MTTSKLSLSVSLVASTFLLQGCLETMVAAPPVYRYVKAFETDIPLERAKAQCEYELQLQKAADRRMDASYVSIAVIRGLPHPVEAACMKRLGYAYERTDGK